MPQSAPEHRIAAVRRFNRFYTRQIGLLRDGARMGPFSLTEARVLHELATGEKPNASAIAAELGLDHGYLSRILADFEKKKLLTRKRSVADARQSFLSLTAKGRKAYAPLHEKSQKVVAEMIGRLAPADQARIVDAMSGIERLLAGGSTEKPKVTFREHRPGDMGWVTARHGVLYAQEYGWGSRIEAITADIVSSFLKNFDPKRECCWIAELNGETVGSVFLVRENNRVARLRLLIVDPRARGLGIGKRLVDECIIFARRAGYEKITLWTHVVLSAARAIYKQAGFHVVKEWVHDDFGKPEASEEWELDL